VAPFYRGRVLAAQGDLVAAEAAFGEALAIDPKFVPALYFRAHVCAARGNTEAAKRDLQQILAQDRGNVYAYIALAKIISTEGQPSQALGLLNRAVQAARKDPAPRLALANLLIRQRKFEDAQATLDALLQVSPNNPQAMTLVGWIQFMAGENAKAVDTFRSLAATYTKSTGAYVLLAKALNATKDRLAAIDAARKAVELSPFSAPARSLLAEYMIVGGRPEQALENARDFVAVYPGPDADSHLATVLARLNRADEAKAYLTSRLAAKPDRLLALHFSQLAMDTGDRKKAIAVLSEWLKKKPSDYDVRRQYAASLLRIGNSANARKEFEALLKRRPEDPIVLNNLAWIVRAEDPEHAYSMILLAAKVAPDSTAIMDTLAWLKYERRDLQGALLILRRAHDLDAGDGEIGYHFAVALEATGRRAEAKTILQAVVAKSPEFDDTDSAKRLLARW
jgi:putative PEP-CTERM system TPR-repeat lipoprotein